MIANGLTQDTAPVATREQKEYGAATWNKG
jgi:hypothetical protein